MDIGIRIMGLTFIFVLVAFGLFSLWERERRAAKVSFYLAIFLSGVFFLIAILPQTILLGFFIVFGGLVVAFSVLLILPIGKVEYGVDVPQTRFDERDVVFARYYLVPGSDNYKSYYAMRPKNEGGDEQMRNRPGLYSPNARIVNPTILASPKASFFLTDELYSAVDGPISESEINLSREEMTAYIKQLARYYGALDVGIAPLKPHHVYSHNGRGSGVYGEPIQLDHKFAIAFTVEMDHKMMKDVVPRSMETAKQYVEMARIAVQLAAAIRFLGYSARANFEGDYQVIVPLIARDAGLGEFGKMSVLITPNHGPRVRIAVVTTDLNLISDLRRDDTAVLDFCTMCEKCAENCPSGAIPFGERKEIGGAWRWKIDAEACYRYWNTSGVDCAICVAVCPYSHPDNPAHNFVRWGVSKSGFFRRVALRMDDVFYGRTQPSPNGPAWIRVASKEV
jgi:ferredoxin